MVNAMATGMGAALGISLWTKARVTLTDHAGSILAHNLTDHNADDGLVKATVRRALSAVHGLHRCGATVETSSNIPVAVGLKSSSAASNAITLATLGALGRKFSDTAVVNLAVDASLKAGVTLTGAFDDGTASHSGGLVVTDNYRRRVLKRFAPSRGLRVLIHVPDGRKYSGNINRKPLRAIATTVALAHREALKGNYWLALTLNGFAYSTAFGSDTRAAKLALEAGAIAAGLTGKGPAVAAIVPQSNVNSVLSRWHSLPGRVIETSMNFRKSKVRRPTN